jgi:hypothetical protein
MADAPRLIDRKTAAALVSANYFSVSERTLRRWPLATRAINGRALLDREELIAHVERLIAKTQPVKQSGRS